MRKRNVTTLLIIILFFICCNNKKPDNNKKGALSETQTTDTTIQSEPVINNIKYETYCNGRFGFCIDYPSDVLIPQGESANGDGQIFESGDSENILWVYKDYRDNINPQEPFDISVAFNEDTDDQTVNTQKTITYKYLDKKYYVISGYENGKIFYQKTILTKDGLATAIINYNESEKNFYDNVAEQIFKTFRWHEHGWQNV